MRMLCSCIHKQFFKHLASQTILRQHALYSPLYDSLRPALQQTLGSFFLLTAGVSGKVNVDLLIHLVPAEEHLIGIDHDNKISGVYMGGIRGLVFPAQYGCNPGTNTTDGLISTIHNIPVALDGSLVRVFGGKM